MDGMGWDEMRWIDGMDECGSEKKRDSRKEGREKKMLQNHMDVCRAVPCRETPCHEKKCMHTD